MAESVATEDLDTAVSKTVEYMSNIFQTRKDLAEEPKIIKNCFPGRSNIYDDVLKLALQRLSDQHGYRVIDVEAMARNKTKIRKYFHVHNNVNDDDLQLTQNQKAYEIHLVNVLTKIIIENGRCHENVIWESLIRIQIFKYEGRFEMLRKLILIDFKKHMYVRTSGTSRRGIYLMWGLRAYEEFDYDLHHLRAYSAKVLALHPLDFPELEDSGVE